METPTKLAIGHANTLLREGLKRLLHDFKEFLVVGDAADDVETMDLVEQAKPDVLLLDLNIPKLEAVPILMAIKEKNLPTRVLILSLLLEESQILNSARAGARGYILKSTPFAALAQAIGDVARGRIWVDTHEGFAETFALVAHRAKISHPMEGEPNPLDVLSKRELQILNLMARGVSNEEIGKKLSIKRPTVKAHASNIFAKLKVENRTQAALFLMHARSRDSEGYSAHLLRSA